MNAVSRCSLKEIQMHLALGTFSNNDLLCLAINESTPKKILDILPAYCRHGSLVALNSNTSRKTLKRLAICADNYTRINVIDNPNIDMITLKVMGKYDNDPPHSCSR